MYNGSDWDYSREGEAVNYAEQVYNSIMLEPIWKNAATYSIKFYPNGSGVTGSMSDMTGLSAGEIYTLTNCGYRKTGYTCTWNTKADGSGVSYANKASVNFNPTVNNSTIKLYAIWKPVKYTITYNLNGGTNSTVNPATYYITTKTITLANAAKKGYVFGGWYTDSSFKNKAISIPQGSVGNRTFYAKFTPIKYTITFNGNKNNSGATKTMSCVYNKAYNLNANGFKKTGYAFAGWNTKADGKGVKYTNKQAIKNLSYKNGANITLYAQWTKVKYTITYNLNGGTNSTKNPTAYYVNSKSIALQNATKKGYVFGGWYADAKYKTKVTAIPTGSVGNKVLYAKWTPITYTVAFNGNKNTSGSMTAMKCIYNKGYNLSANAFKKTGYVFTGWNTKADGSGVSYTNKQAIKNLAYKNGANVTLYAQWKKNK